MGYDARWCVALLSEARFAVVDFALGPVLSGAITPTRAAILTVSQILGGIVGAAIIQAILPGTLNCRTTLIAGMSVARGLFLEMFLTSMLMLAMCFPSLADQSLN